MLYGHTEFHIPIHNP